MDFFPRSAPIKTHYKILIAFQHQCNDVMDFLKCARLYFFTLTLYLYSKIHFENFLTPFFGTASHGIIYRLMMD